jgi:hypothetical protein
MDGNWSRWNEDCTNWCSLGPFPGWLWSVDHGQSWHSSGHFPQGETRYYSSTSTGSTSSSGGDDDGDGAGQTRLGFHAVGGVSGGGLFGECAGHEISVPLQGQPGGGASFVKPCAVKFTYLRPVDYGQDNHHSPDGKMYFTAYGSSRPDGPVSWMSGDEAHLCRVDPKLGPAALNNRSSYEFYAGETSAGEAKWSAEMSDAQPLFRWWNQTGITAVRKRPTRHAMHLSCRIVESLHVSNWCHQ